jgi:hypothetical protein
MLFQKYQQIHSRETDTKGTGLGLVIAQRIASLLKTNIQIESPWRKTLVGESEGGKGGVEGGDSGGGTRFFFSVDNCVRGESGSKNLSIAAYPPSPSSSTAGLAMRRVDRGVREGGTLRHGLNILVVDDDMMNRMIMSMKLSNSEEFKHLEMVVQQAGNEVDVEELMSEHNAQYDVIIMDEHLGEESAKGSVITRRLRDQVRGERGGEGSKAYL